MRSPKQAFASVARTVMVKAPKAVGAPESTPLEESSINPPGKLLLLTLQVMAPFPLVCVNSTGPYARPAVPFGKVVGPTVIVGQVTVSVKLASVVAPQLSVARTVMVCVPPGFALLMETTPLPLTETVPAY